MKHVRLSLLGTALLIAACGGSGEPFGSTGTTTPTFAITSANATTAARVSWEATVASRQLANLGEVLGISPAAPGGSSKATPTGASGGLVFDILQKVPLGPDVFPCGNGAGTVTISGDIADPLTLTAGDTFAVVYAFCDEGFGKVTDGTVEFTVNDFSGDFLLGEYLLSMRAVITNLQVATGTDTVTSNGDVTLALDTMSARSVQASLFGTSLQIDTNSGSASLTNYSSDQTLDTSVSPSPYTMNVAGTLDSTRLAGVVSYSTPVTFAGFGVDFPQTGQLLVQGTESSVRLVAVDDVNVRIEIDLNGDGVADETIDTTWAELTA